MRHKFDDLPRNIREKLVELSRNPADPRVLISDGSWGSGWFKYFTLLGGLGACFASLQFLFERSSDGIAPYHDREIFMGLAAGVFVVLASVASIVFLKLFPPPPYKTGQFALTSYLMRLSRGWVELTPLSTLGKPTVVTVLRNGSYSGSRLEFGGGWTFYFGSRDAVDKACGRVLAARDVFMRVLGARDAQALALIDPFSECTLSGQWTSPGGYEQAEGPRSGEVPGVARLVQWLGSLAAGGGVAFALFLILQAKTPHG